MRVWNVCILHKAGETYYSNTIAYIKSYLIILTSWSRYQNIFYLFKYYLICQTTFLVLIYDHDILYKYL